MDRPAWRPLALALATIGAASAGAGREAVAQTLSDVVVSASRSEQRSFDAPAAIQGIGSETIREAGPQVNLSESMNRVPGVVVLNRQNYAQDLQLSIRGFGARSTFGIRGVRLIVDGIPATMPDGQGQASTISLPSAARIEVLRGPLAQLYGNAAGGIVQVFTEDGPPVPYVGGSLSTGSYGTQRYGLKAGGQTGLVNYVVDLSDFNTNGYRDNSETKRRQLNTKLRFDLSANTKLTVVGNFFDQPLSKDPLGLTRAQYETNPRQTPAIATAQDTGKVVSQNQIGTVLDHTLDANNKLTARFYFGQRDLYSKLSVPLANQAPATSAGGIVDLDRGYSGIGLQWNNRARVGGEQFVSVAGIDYDRMKERRRGFVNNGGVQGGLKRDENDTVSNFDLYAQTNWLVNTSWTVTAGLRSSRVQFSTDDFFVVAGNPDDSGKARYSALNPVAGVTYHLNENINLYANWGRGFETPTFTELAYRNGASGLNFGLQAARGKHMEIGTKARLSENHRVDLALFSIDTSNEIVVDTNAGGRTTYRNAGRTSREGLELSYTGRFAPTVTGYVALTTLNARFQDAFAGGGGAVSAGNRLPGVPDRVAYGEVAWRPQTTGALAGFNAAIEMFHSGKLFVNDSNTDSTSAYTVFNLRAGLQQKIGALTLREFVRIDNLADKKYAGSVIVNDGNQRFFESAPGRNWMVGLYASWEFR